MDAPSLPETEHHHHHHQNQLYPQHQHPPVQPPQPHYYDPAQLQSYDQSYYNYYYHYPQPNYPLNQPQQPNYAYYPPDYATAYHQPQQHYHPAPPPHESVAPPGVSGSVEAAQDVDSGGVGSVQVQQQGQGAYSLGQSSGNAVVVPSGLNPAAAAAVMALSQLTQFAGTMDAAERAIAGLQSKFGGPSMHPPVGQHHYRGSSTRRGRGHHPGSPFRGGRGRGRGKFRSTHLQSQGATNTESSDSKRIAQSVSGPSRQRIAWCELCRVDCTSLEILEQHKNGKRHKKNLLRMDELKKAVRPEAEVQNVQEEPTSDSKTEVFQQPEVAQEDEEKQPTENLSTAAISNENVIDTNMQNNRDVSSEHAIEENKLQNEELDEVPMEGSSGQQERKGGMDGRRGVKRKMKSSRGGKRMRSHDIPRLPIEPPKPKVVIPLICDLCNVKCDTQEVFNRHLSGKKHISKLKRFESHQAMYGPLGLQALYPPNPMAETLSVPQANQPPYDPHGYFPPQAAPATAGLDYQSLPLQSESALEHAGGNNSALVVTENV